MLQHDITTHLQFTQAKYDSLVKKVNEYLTLQSEYNKSKDQRLKLKIWELERELKKIINPVKSSQATIEWMAK